MIEAVQNRKPGSKRSSKFWAVSALFACSLLFLLFQGGKLAFMVFNIVSVICLYLGLGRWSGIAYTHGGRTFPSNEHNHELAAGSTLHVKLNIQVPGVWPIPYVFVNERIVRRNGEQYQFESSVFLNWRRKGEFTYSILALRRGVYRFMPTDCATEDVFGMFRHKGTFDVPHTFKIIPQTVPIGEWQQFQRMHNGNLFHAATTQAIRETTQINGVREYIYGDRISRIHWNATARTGTWKSKEYERESLPKTIIVLDRNKRAYSSQANFELAVSIAASLFAYGDNNNLSLGLLSVGKDAVYIDPKKNAIQRQQISNHLIEVEADGSHSLQTVVSDRLRTLPIGSFFILITPDYNDSVLQTLKALSGKQMNACHIRAADGETRTQAEEEWTSILRSKGFLGYNVKSLQQLPACLEGRPV